MPVSVHAKARSFSPRSQRRLRAVFEYLLRKDSQSDGLLEIEVVGNQRIRSLNQRYRRKDKETDVLSFPMHWRAPHRGSPWLLGSIVIAWPVAMRQARMAERAELDQVIRLAVHGWVHLSGLDHERSQAAAKRFQNSERKLLMLLKRKGLMKWDGSLRF